ncbi:MAG: bifunctional folylpolyglutamate synthase/dihydrofolate synthase [Ardenticatenales bacterium]|nr:bifunctional folylpolyglutamate synthase/dihydrofolate synthase [Ardenticatenales bacterium]
MHEINSYDEALAYLNSFINYEKKPADQFSAEMMAVDRPVRLLAALGNPHQAYPSIHVAGTKGKGSTSALCAAALHAAGYRVGLYTSPHLLDLRERFRVLTPSDADGRVSEADFVELVRAVQAPVAAQSGLTWYEIFTALAFLHFAREKVDVAVVEVGLGGRLDATNAITPLVSVISSISLDHMSLLGDTVAQIAGEKGGIIKPGVPVVIAPQVAEARARLVAIAAEKQAPLVEVGRDWQGELTVEVGGGQWLRLTKTPAGALLQPGAELQLGLLGPHQGDNSLLALAALHLVQPALPQLDGAALAEGLREVVWPGRLQQMPVPAGAPTVIVDGAHNGDSAAKLLVALRIHFRYERLFLIMSSGVDKDYEAMLRHFGPGADQLILTAAPHPRAATPEMLLETTRTLALDLPAPPRTAPNLEAALQQAAALAGPADLICVTGSLFLVAELLKEWHNWHIF